MRKRYIVKNNGHFETFSKAVIDQMKSLDLIEFRSSTRTNEALVLNYTAKNKGLRPRTSGGWRGV